MKCRECKIASVSFLDWLFFTRCTDCFLNGYIKWKAKQRKSDEVSK